MRTYTIIDNETGEVQEKEAILLSYWNKATIKEDCEDYRLAVIDKQDFPEITDEIINQLAETLQDAYDKYGEVPTTDSIIDEFNYLTRNKEA